MKARKSAIKSVVASLALAMLTVSPLRAATGELDAALAALARAEGAEAETLAGQVRMMWSRSGSAAMDLLLARGREALEAGDDAAAIEHLTALTDHAPGFAEGWHARATALFARGRWGQALEDLARTLALEPRHFGALSGLALILEQTGREAAALEALRRLREIYPAREGLDAALERLDRATGGRTL